MYSVDRCMKPSEIRFTQDSIRRIFQNKQSVNGSVRSIMNKELHPSDFPPIEVFFRNDKIYSLNNRRLYVFRVCEIRGLLSTIKVTVTDFTSYHKRRFTTKNDGLTIIVRGRGSTLTHHRREWLSTTTVKATASIRENYESIYRPLRSTSGVPNTALKSVNTKWYSDYATHQALETMEYQTLRTTTAVHEKPITASLRTSRSTHGPATSRRSHLSRTHDIKPMKKVSGQGYTLNGQTSISRKQPQSESLYEKEMYERNHSKNVWRPQACWLPTSANGRYTVSSDEDEEDYSADRLAGYTLNDQTSISRKQPYSESLYEEDMYERNHCRDFWRPHTRGLPTSMNGRYTVSSDEDEEDYSAVGLPGYTLNGKTSISRKQRYSEYVHEEDMYGRKHSNDSWRPQASWLPTSMNGRHTVSSDEDEDYSAASVAGYTLNDHTSISRKQPYSESVYEEDMYGRKHSNDCWPPQACWLPTSMNGSYTVSSDEDGEDYSATGLPGYTLNGQTSISRKQPYSESVYEEDMYGRKHSNDSWRPQACWLPTSMNGSHSVSSDEDEDYSADRQASYTRNDQSSITRNQPYSESVYEVEKCGRKHTKDSWRPQADWLPTSMNGRYTVSSDEDEEDYSADRQADYTLNDQTSITRNRPYSESIYEVEKCGRKHTNDSWRPQAGWLPTSINGRYTVSSDEDEEDYSAAPLAGYTRNDQTSISRKQLYRESVYKKESCGKKHDLLRPQARVWLDREQRRIGELLADLKLQDYA